MSDSNDHQDSSGDNWGSAADVYVSRSERVTRPPVEELISCVNSIRPFSAPNTHILDNGCGTGALTTAVNVQYPTARIIASDLSPGMVKAVEQKKLKNVQTMVLDAMDLHPFQPATFTHVLSTFAIQFVPDPLRAMSEMYRVTVPGGVIGLGTWGNLDMNAPWTDACRTFEPGYTSPNYGFAEGWSTEEQVKAQFEKVGCSQVETRIVRPKWKFKGDEYIQFWFESKIPAIETILGPWRESGKIDEVRPVFERIVKEKYNGGQDFGMEAILAFAKK
ncbi:MAG: hypothetical protein Q9187_005540 [Circinaria calcarea]